MHTKFFIDIAPYCNK